MRYEYKVISTTVSFNASSLAGPMFHLDDEINRWAREGYLVKSITPYSHSTQTQTGFMDVYGITVLMERLVEEQS